MNSPAPQALVGLKKPLFYLYMMTYVWIKYTCELLQFKIGLVQYVVFLKRLLIALQGFYSNKIVKVNGQYKIQLYLPAFPSKAYFYAIEKFDPRRKCPGAISVVFSMTKACTYKCPHCYQRNDKGPDLDINLLKQTAREMQDLGVAMFDIEGGEPLLKFDRLIDLLSVFDERTEVWVNTTGHGLTEDKVLAMKKSHVYGVMISVHSADQEKYDKFTGIPGAFETATKALRMFSSHGIVTAINYCPSAEEIRNGGVEKLIELARELDVSLVQVIHAKPSGALLYEKDEIFESVELMEVLKKYHRHYNESSHAVKYPGIIFQVLEEDEDHFGCTAGGIDRFYLNHEGEVQPCEFLNISFGNVQQESFLKIFERMRKSFAVPGTKWPCCSEAYSIGEAIKNSNIAKTPLPAEFSEALVKTWNKGKPTKLYERIGMYKK